MVNLSQIAELLQIMVRSGRTAWALTLLLGFIWLFEISHARSPEDISRHVARYRSFALDVRWKAFLRSPPSAEIDAAGMVGLNRGGMRYPELQAVGGAYVVRGLLNARQDWRETGWRVLDAGLSGMAADGRLAGLPNDLVHSSSFLLYSYGEALVVDADAATTDRVARYLTALRHLSTGPPLEEGRTMVRRFTHRAFLWSFMFECGHALDPAAGYDRLARQFLETGLSQQSHDGVFPEVGGFDALYQAIGLDFLFRTAAFAEPEAQDRPQWAGVRGLSVLIARIGEGGRLDIANSTRVTREKTRTGTSKRLSHWQIAQPLVSAWVATSDKHFKNVADRVMRCDVACQTGDGAGRARR